MKKFFIFFLALAASMSLRAVVINGIAYNLDEGTQTAEVTSNETMVEIGGMWSSRNYDGVTSIIIPPLVKYNDVTYSVTSIGQMAFYNCYALTSVNIPNSVTSIGQMAFNSCSQLTKLIIPNSVTELGDDVFCTSLTNITCLATTPPTCVAGTFHSVKTSTPLDVPKGKVADYRADANWSYFMGNTYETNILAAGTCGDDLVWDLWSTTETLYISGTGAMLDFSTDNIPWKDFISSVKSLWISSGVTSIGVYAFYLCSNLISVTIPEGVTSIKNNAFWKCSKLASVVIPNSVISIGNSAFRESGLTSVTIGNSVASIGNRGFNGCSQLASITCKATTPPTCGAECFTNVTKTIPLHVPNGTGTAYGTANVWSDFTNIIEDAPTAIDTVTNNPSPVTNKLLRDGQILILRGDKTYTITGQEVK